MVCIGACGALGPGSIPGVGLLLKQKPGEKKAYGNSLLKKGWRKKAYGNSLLSWQKLGEKYLTKRKKNGTENS